MKWATPKEYDERVVTRFLFFPKALHEHGAGYGDRRVTKWLQFVKIEQIYGRAYSYMGESKMGWEHCRWAEDEQKT